MLKKKRNDMIIRLKKWVNCYFKAGQCLKMPVMVSLFVKFPNHIILDCCVPLMKNKNKDQICVVCQRNYRPDLK